MQNLKSGLVAILLAAVSVSASATASVAQVCSCPGVDIRAEEAPPPLPDYDQPPMPAPGYMFTPGYWAWNNEDYYWVPGVWVEPPRAGVLWTPGYWGYSNGLYVFNPGYWGPHIGFYGGVAYGFGYGGSGYLGGRWNNGVFFYNQSVNNLGAHGGGNIYNEPLPPGATSTGRASFNGGAGGTAAKPTPEEEAAAKEPHEKPTLAQTQNTRAASTNAGSFASTNHGVPAVAAVGHPGALTGADAVRARPVGGEPAPKGAAPPVAAPQPQHGLPRPLSAAPVPQHALPHPQPPVAPSPQPAHQPPHSATPPKPAQAPQPQVQAPQPQVQAPQPQVQAPQPQVHAPKPQVPAPQPQVHAPQPQVHAPPKAKPPAEHPRCGGHGEPPCH